MSIVPIWRRCLKCHRMYDWNPDVGNYKCPYCFGIEKVKGGKLSNWLKKKQKMKRKTNCLF